MVLRRLLHRTPHTCRTHSLLINAFTQTLLSPGHRLVSLDTNYCIVQNFYLVLSSVNDAYYDLGQQLKWLNTTLAAARVHCSVPACA